MKNFLLLSLLGFLLFSCAGKMICDCFDGCEDAVSFAFSPDSSANGFKPEEVDTVVLYRLAKGQTNKLDSLVYTFRASQNEYFAGEYGLTCGASKTITLQNINALAGTNPKDFDYLISVPKLKTYKITNLEIEGKTGSGDCSCYTNTKKVIIVNGVQHDLSGKEVPENVIVLSR